ncbi:MAG: hypothetical protein MR598_07120 [Erysipelotrichaceae bacterium]|nr:hypothetical protein [Erysipelotrichaceae bacterium]
MMKLLDLLKKIKKQYFFLILFLSFGIFPLNIFALSENYVDRVSSITNTEVEEEKINLYLFRGEGCPHCAEEEEWLDVIKEDYKDYLNIYEFEVWNHPDNAKLMDEVKAEFKVTSTGVPFTVIGDNYFVGFSDTTSVNMENKIKEYAGLENNPNEISLPILGVVNIKNVSIPIVAIILGFIDGFNPCAMWILLFLINMFLGMKDKKKSWILGFTFLLISSFVYFLSMLGINLILNMTMISSLKILIGVFILIAGGVNLRKYLKTRKEEAGCSVVDSKKRKKLITRMRKIIESKSFALAFVGIVCLAASINLIELACSLGFPMIFTEILTLNEIDGIFRIIYLLIYIFFYMIDDIVVFAISMVTLQTTGITNKYNKLCTLISAIIMIVMGLLLLFKPEWLMLNF